MKQIPEIFKANKHTYKLLKRHNNIAIYTQFNSKGLPVGFEVHFIRIRLPRHTKFRQSDGSYRIVNMPKREILAGNEEFGKYGWYFEKYSNALSKFNELKQKKEDREVSH